MAWFIQAFSDISNISAPTSSTFSSDDTAADSSESQPRQEALSPHTIGPNSLGVDNEGLEPEITIDHDQQILRFSRLPREVQHDVNLADQQSWIPRRPRPRSQSATLRVANLKTFIKSLKKAEPEFELFEIRRGYKGDLGFKIEGGLDTPCVEGDSGIFVQSIMPGSNAYGKLLPGDRILSVNDVNISHVTRRQAKNVIAKADGRIVQLYIKRATKRQQTVDNALKLSDYSQANIFSRQQVEEFEDAFSVYNKDGSNSIKTTLVFQLIRSLGHNPPEHEVWIYLNELGLTANSKLNFQDFVKLMAVIVSGQNEEKEISSALSVFDTDQRGYITVEELTEAFERMPGRARMRDWELKDIIRKADPAQRGMIPVKEFRNLLLPSMTLY